MTGFGLSAGAKPLAEHVQVVALYEPDGRIAHLHMVTTLGNAVPLSSEKAIDEARRRASRHHRDVDALAVALSNQAEHGQAPHRIDPVTKAFVALPQARAPRGQAPSAS